MSQESSSRAASTPTLGSAMGRFDPKYPPEAIAELYRLVLDAEPCRSVPQAVAEIAGTHGVEINKGTAGSYVQREKLRRRMGNDSPLPEDQREALDVIGRRVIAELDVEVRRIARAVRPGKPLDVNRACTIARAIKELRAGLGPRTQAKPVRGDESEPDDDETSSNGQPSAVVADLLAAHDSESPEVARLRAAHKAPVSTSFRCALGAQRGAHRPQSAW